MRFEVVIGVEPGYGKQYDGDAAAAVAAAWQDAQEAVWKSRGVYVSAAVLPCKMVYWQQWGCPEGGEHCAMVVGHGHPTFVKDAAAWKAAVVDGVALVRATLKQSSVTVYFWDGTHEDMRG